MPRKARLSDEQAREIARAHNRGKGETLAALAQRYGVSRATASRAARKVRTADEFRGASAVRPTRRRQARTSWSVEAIRAARDAQIRGDFEQPARLAEAMRTDDALFVAYHNRIAPQSALRARLHAHSSTRGEAIAKKAESCVSVPRSVIESIHGALANHGIAIAYTEHDVSDDGARVDFRVTEWPIEHVRWNESREVLETRTKDGRTVDVVHGDGRWTVFRKFNDRPWTQEACILPGALLWAAHADGVRDWAAASFAHGQAKIMGELPEGVALLDANGLTPEAESFLQMLEEMVSGEAGAGIRPAGAKADFVANGSTAWQVFSELIVNREKAAARIYLGTDAILGSVGGAPGVDISALFGVASTKLQGDLEAIEQALYSGVFAPWCAMNFGDSRLAPCLKYDLPDVDGERKSQERSGKLTRLLDLLQRMREQGMAIDQATVDALASDLGVSPPPQLAEADDAAVVIDLAPTDVARVVRVREARASRNLPPLGDARDDLFISELEAQAEAKADDAEASTVSRILARIIAHDPAGARRLARLLTGEA